MGRKIKVLMLLAVVIVLAFVAKHYIHPVNAGILTPHGEIAAKQKDLIVKSTLLMLIVVIPVYIMTFFFSWHYRESNTKAKYQPEWDGNSFLETIWWGVPFVIIFILAVMAWNSSHSLDPFRPLASDKRPLTVQVVALQWRWLFIYPEQHIASINHIDIPTNTPINFQLTSDAPMNSFWVPQLGGQVYTMAGMNTQLHLQADKPGEYRGLSANISGKGFSNMEFVVSATNENSFNDWVTKVKSGQSVLSDQNYKLVAAPNDKRDEKYFAQVDDNLYDSIIMKYEMPSYQHPHSNQNFADFKTKLQKVDRA